MGDNAENALQPSKKRAAGREISRDNPGLDDDDEDSPEQELGTFKKASEEVLATRRIVKVRRGPPPPSSSVPPPASTNPFAGIKLVPPTLAKPNPNPEPKLGDESEKGNEEEDESKLLEPEEPPKPVAEEEEEEVVTEKKGREEEEEEEIATTTTTHSLSSFQQLSSSQNAFTNLSGTGFSTSTFSFGPIKSDGPGSGFGFSNNGAGGGYSSLFTNSSSSSSMAAKTEAAAAMKEVEVETGEENEEAVFSSDSVLYEFTGSLWKERGKGEVKINVSKQPKTRKRVPEDGGVGPKARLVMRAKGNYRLILNASLFPDMKLTAMDKKGLSFACVNSTAGDEDEESKEKTKFSTFALKFKDPSIVDEFRRAFAAHKGKSPAAAPEIATGGLQTPENSPKASSD